MAMDLTVAHTIMAQLGGQGRLMAMLGAHSFSGEKDRLRFKIKCRAAQNIKCINIVLEASDTYRVEFWSIHGVHVKKVAEVTGVYCDQLGACVERATKLRVRL